MKPGAYTLTIIQGATLNKVFTWKDSDGVAINLTGYTARMQVRDKVAAADVLLELTTSDGITLGGTAGTITLARTAAQTAAITWRQGVYDLELVSAGGVVTRLLEGFVTVSPEVTR